jgi:hypothetical protein
MVQAVGAAQHRTARVSVARTYLVSDLRKRASEPRTRSAVARLRSDAQCQRAISNQQSVSRELGTLLAWFKLIAEYIPARHVCPTKQFYVQTVDRPLHDTMNFCRLLAMLARSLHTEHGLNGTVHEAFR